LNFFSVFLLVQATRNIAPAFFKKERRIVFVLMWHQTVFFLFFVKILTENLSAIWTGVACCYFERAFSILFLVLSPLFVF